MAKKGEQGEKDGKFFAVRDLPERTKKQLKLYAVEHDLTMAEALAQLVDAGLGSPPAAAPVTVPQVAAQPVHLAVPQAVEAAMVAPEPAQKVQAIPMNDDPEGKSFAVLVSPNGRMSFLGYEPEAIAYLNMWLDHVQRFPLASEMDELGAQMSAINRAASERKAAALYPEINEGAEEETSTTVEREHS